MTHKYSLFFDLFAWAYRQKNILSSFSFFLDRQTDERGHSVEDIEEYITLLSYMMQSYVRLHSPVLQSLHNDYPLCDHTDAVKEFSEEDLSYLREIKDHLSGVRTRCKSLLKKGQKLSSRTDFLLLLMDVNINV